ncbi:photosystem I reaction center subunit N, chloroplast precursor [Volvox carteri f. nagariensis]|uniref:Photosystem I reaction center subunit N, chloroplastic n=2 Tax=Volvox carteri TaxID=3067 RepID=PSAN_VOLCA|nr:photosystem I reaction center subunit N, chloroplast precursor [Volvox carteri f. nagariensis]Q9SBN5.1 RecName: Full=Photosystem I reaction center subunit N, chloroplastic; Short=PSI-N; Flags: Precursor [Volvox carteri]AAD55563.1 photosystem I reaction center subunit PSAN precursor [Volvox carteri f. nagariensis]EFJ45295.1 photosystem I reaction center subunit N, chloroplast precursor [Volvox carteri f. nagariensis]|eukprot:XP_002953671.1 photosystem I reaction center subunit N, chloroplast precursor [Volvox carteri f. nagariensis]
MAVAMRAQCAKVQAARPARATTVVCRASAQSRRELLGLGVLLGAAALAPAANAGVVEDLLAKSAANKALNNKKRLATSYANLARSRTVYDGTCQFPENFFGCEELAFNKGVKYIAEDLKIECEGKDAKSCGSKFTLRSK